MSEPPRKRMGRPPAAGAARTERVVVRFTTEEHEAFRTWAQGQDLAAWIRDACLLRIGREVVRTPNKVQPDEIEQIFAFLLKEAQDARDEGAAHMYANGLRRAADFVHLQAWRK